MSSGTPFDPCRQWLGVSALELDDPRKLLGLEPAEDDPIRILQAAEARLAHLQSVNAGPFEVARRALMARVEEARDKLLAAAAYAIPAPPVPAGGLAMPRRPFSGSEAASPVGASQEYPQPMQASVGYPSPETMVPPALGNQHGTLRGTGPIYRPPSSNGPLLLLVGALFTVVAALALFAFQSPSPPVKTASKKATQTAKTDEAERPRSKPPTTQPKTAQPRTQPAMQDDDRPDTPDASSTQNRPEDSTPRTPPMADEQDEPSAPPAPNEPEMADEPMDAPPRETPTKPKPELEPPTTKPEPPGTDEPDPLARIDDAVKTCLKALARREFDTAQRAMKAVAELAPDKREADRIAGWLQLVTYAKGFYDYRDQAIEAAKSGDEYDVGKKKIAIIEVNDEALTAKVAGQLKTWKRDDIPGAIMQAVVTSWFDDKPANQLYLGAYHFTKPEPAPELAEACWSKGMIGGADASLLIPLLTDPVVVDGAADAGGAP